MNDIIKITDNISNVLNESSYKKIQDAATGIANTVRLGLSPNYLKLCETAEAMMAPFKQYISELPKVVSACQNTLANIVNEIASIYKSSFWNWLNSFDFSSILDNIEEKKIATYMQIMYDCKWFPLVGLISIDDSLVSETCSIAASSRGASKRRERRIDKIVLEFYDANAIKSIKRGWDESDLESYFKRMLKQAINAHLRGEYYLTISGLAPLWESLIRIKEYGGICQQIDNDTKKKNKNTEMAFLDLTKQNGYNGKIDDFYSNYIISPCYNEQQKIEGLPNRNGVAHGKWFKYPTQKESLNAILITDFIINLQAIKQENNNG